MHVYVVMCAYHEQDLRSGAVLHALVSAVVGHDILKEATPPTHPGAV
jgi:hypothetical protein